MKKKTSLFLELLYLYEFEFIENDCLINLDQSTLIIKNQ